MLEENKAFFWRTVRVSRFFYRPQIICSCFQTLKNVSRPQARIKGLVGPRHYGLYGLGKKYFKVLFKAIAYHIVFRRPLFPDF